MPPSIRAPKAAAAGDRKTALEVAKLALPAALLDGETESVWLEEGTAPAGFQVLELASMFAAKLEAERKKTTVEVFLNMSLRDGFGENDHVRIADRQSRHHGKSALVWFVRNGRVMVSIPEPGSIGGAVSDSFLPEHLERLEDPAPVNIERAVLLRFMRENALMYDNLSSTQERCTVLLLATRAMRQRIMELGGEDPGAP